MHPSFGVPWPRLQRAAERLCKLNAAAGYGHVHALLFLCGLKYLLTYREANGRRLSHYLDDGLREAADHTLPALMKCCRAIEKRSHGARMRVPPTPAQFQRLVFAFQRLHCQLPAFTSRWAEHGKREANMVRLSFGMGVIARFAPDSHDFIRQMLAEPLRLRSSVADVVESFHWNAEWSLVLAP